MDPARWSQIEQLYHSALEKPAAERPAFLEQACAGDPTLRQEVESLLAIADDADGYLKAAVQEVTTQATGAAAARQTSPGLPETRKLGRYELLEQVGQGGMGIVYRAVDPAIGRTVAIKTIRLDDRGEQSSELRTRLLRESQAGGRLSHPNIVAVYDVCEEGQTAYIVMEFVVGRTLDRAMAAAPSISQPEAHRIVQECAAALDYAHARGVVHRDIKPANILLQTDGAVKITDFGIAKAAQFTPLTQSSVIVGSPHYMAPEQWKGQAVSGRTDQYALATIAFALFTGRPPFETEAIAALAAKTLYDEPPPATSLNPSLPRAIDDVFRRALAKNPEARYETCTQFAAAIRSACDKPTAASPAPHVPPPAHRGHWLAASIMLAVVLALAGGAWLYQRNSAAQYEIAYWTSIKDSKTAASFESYLKRYPQGQFAALAQAQLEALRNPPPLPNPQPPVIAKKSIKAKPTTGNDTVEPPPVPKPDPPAAGDPYAQADLLLKRGAYAEALPYFSRAIALKPDYHSYFGRAGAYQRLEQWQQAVDDYSQAVALQPATAMPYHERAVCLAHLNQDDRALADYNRALELAPAYALSWNGRGVIHLHRKEYDQAISDFTEAIRLRPSYDQPYRNRAAARKAIGDLAGANADLAQARALQQ